MKTLWFNCIKLVITRTMNFIVTCFFVDISICEETEILGFEGVFEGDVKYCEGKRR